MFYCLYLAYSAASSAKTRYLSASNAAAYSARTLSYSNASYSSLAYSSACLCYSAAAALLAAFFLSSLALCLAYTLFLIWRKAITAPIKANSAATSST